MINMQDVQRGYDAWAAKPHNAKWVRRIDGTPIANDIVVNIFDAIKHGQPIELDGIAEELAEQSGAWLSCTGCHETDEGVPTGPYSAVMKCHLGLGCKECGGIGAVWDSTDWSGLASASQPCPDCDGLGANPVTGEDCGLCHGGGEVSDGSTDA